MVFKEAKWILPPAFAGMAPIQVLHKQNTKVEIPQPEALQNLHFLFKGRFEKPAADTPVLLRITADDYYKVSLNGVPVGMGPAQGYHFDYYWNEYDITYLLREGENELTADVYYHGLVSRSFQSADRRMGLIAEVICGGRVVAATGQGWECGISEAYKEKKTLGYETAFLEFYDSRLAKPQWGPVCEIETDHILHPTPTTHLQTYTVRPAETRPLPDGGVFYDFGTELTGHLRITAQGHAGDKVRILHGEEAEEGLPWLVRYENRCSCCCDETWTLADGECTREQYDYKAFRYVALLPDPGVTLTDVTVTVRHYPFDDDYCRLETDNEALLSVWSICKNGVKYGAQEVFVDCPMREKGQYAGDLTVTSASHVILTGDVSLFRKAMDNQMQSAVICPGLMAVTPGSEMQEIADYSLQFPILALRYYALTGDRDYLAENLAVCEGMLTHFEQYARGDGLLSGVADKWNLVDWPENLRDGYDFPLANPVAADSPAHNVLNAFYVGAVGCTEEIRKKLSLPPKRSFRALADAFHRAFFNPETGLYTDAEATHHSTLHSNILPVYFGICPPECEARIGDFIMEKGLACGVYMSYFLLKALCRMGRTGDALRLILSEDIHSWRNMVKEGATTCFEAWGKDQKWNTSLCHPWASAPISVLAEDILPVFPKLGRICFKKC